MKILITGGAGFVGSNLCEYLIKQGHHVIVVDNFITSSPNNIKDLLKNPRFTFFKLDINSIEFSNSFAPAKIKLDQIYHLAFPTGVPNILPMSEEMIQTAAIGTQRVMRLARDHHAPIIVTSSAEVYGDPEVFPQTEDYNGNVSTIGERSSYEEGKRFCESIVAMFVRKYKTNAKIARLFNAYGPRMYLKDPRVHPRQIQQAINNEPVIVYGNGEQTRSFCYVDDTVSGLIKIMEDGQTGEIYNLGSNQSIKIKDLAQKIIWLTNSVSKIKFIKHFIADHNGRLPSVEKIKKLGWQRKVELEQGTIKTIEYIKNTLKI